MAQKIYRQGDCGFVVLTDEEFDAVKPQLKKFGSNLIRRGEHGGRHTMEKKAGAEIMVTKGTKSVKYLISKVPIKILHGEHGVLDLPKGRYKVEVQREVGSAGEPRAVMD